MQKKYYFRGPPIANVWAKPAIFGPYRPPGAVADKVVGFVIFCIALALLAKVL